MQTKDIKIGEDYVLSAYRGIARVRVVETGIQLRTWRDAKKNGVRFEVIDQVDWRSNATTVPSRDIVRPWDAEAQEKMDARRAVIATGERVEREADELGVVAFYGGGRVQIELDDWAKLVARLHSPPSGLHLPLKMPDESEA